MERIKKYLPTVLISAVMPLFIVTIPTNIMFAASVLHLSGDLSSHFVYEYENKPIYCAALGFMLCTFVWLLFHWIVVKAPNEEYTKGGGRVKISIFTQMIVIFFGHIIPFVIVPILFSKRQDPFFVSHGDEGEFIIPASLVVLVSFAFLLLEPVINFFGCMFVNLIWVKFPMFVCNKIKGRRVQAD